MAGYGPPPAENKRRRNQDEYADHAVTVSAGSRPTGAPLLPKAERYRQETRDWYSTWREAPQAVTFLVTDWQRLHMLAPLVDAYWERPSKDLLAEIRLNESLLGATHVDRMRGRIKLEQPKVPTTMAADELANRRRRIVDAS